MVQPRKTRPCLIERLLMGRKESNQTNKSMIVGKAFWLKLVQGNLLLVYQQVQWMILKSMVSWVLAGGASRGTDKSPVLGQKPTKTKAHWTKAN